MWVLRHTIVGFSLEGTVGHKINHRAITKFITKSLLSFTLGQSVKPPSFLTRSRELVLLLCDVSCDPQSLS